MKRALLFVPLLLMLSVSAFAQITPAPELINFQGRLAKPDGTPVTDGTYSIRFSLWSAVSGGAEKWFQQINPVLVKNGTFIVLLGNGNAITADVLNGDTYLEVKVGINNPLSPRQRIASVAYALKANSVPDGTITTAKIADNSVTNAKIVSVDFSKVLNPPAVRLQLPYNGSTSNVNSALTITNNGFGSAAEFRTTNVDNANYISATLFVKSLGSRGDGGYFRVYNPANSDNALNAVNEGLGWAGFFSIDNPNSTSAAIYARTANTGTGLAADFLGTARMTGFRLTTNPQTGYVLTSDGNGNGAWQLAPTNTGPQGQKGDKGDTGSQGPKGDKGDTGPQGPASPSQFSRTILDVPNFATINIPSGYRLIGIQGHGSDATVILPHANSVVSGTFLIVSLETPLPGNSSSVVLIKTQGGDQIPSLPSGFFDVLIYNNFDPIKRYYSDGVSRWYHW